MYKLGHIILHCASYHFAVVFIIISSLGAHTYYKDSMKYPGVFFFFKCHCVNNTLPFCSTAYRPSKLLQTIHACVPSAIK